MKTPRTQNTASLQCPITLNRYGQKHPAESCVYSNDTKQHKHEKKDSLICAPSAPRIHRIAVSFSALLFLENCIVEMSTYPCFESRCSSPLLRMNAFLLFKSCHLIIGKNNTSIKEENYRSHIA